MRKKAGFSENAKKAHSFMQEKMQYSKKRKEEKDMLRIDINLLWTVINMLLIFFVIKRFLFKPVHQILNARKAEVDKQFADAKEAKDSAELLKKQVQEQMNGIDEQKAELISEARGKATKEYERILADAKTQADKIVADAHVQVKRDRDKQVQEAQEHIADLVVAATAKLVADKSNADEDRELYNQFINKAGGMER